MVSRTPRQPRHFGSFSIGRADGSPGGVPRDPRPTTWLVAVGLALAAAAPAATAQTTRITGPAGGASDNAPVGAPAAAPAARGEGALPIGPPDDEVIVTATRLPTPAAQVGSSVTVITADEIERRQTSSVADVLRGTPGVDVARSGGPNQITSVFTRGGNSNHTLVLIDGVPANDPTSPTRAFDFSDLTTDNVDRIEILRGPQSTLWGSNALSGVINVITKRGGEGPPQGYAFAEGGTFNTYREGAGVSGGTKLYNYALSLSQANSSGFSAADREFGNFEDDGFSRSAASGRVGLNVSKNFDVDFIARYQHSRTEIDDFGGPGGDDPHRLLRNNEGFFRVQPHAVLLDGKLESTFGLSYTDYDRRDTDSQFPTHANGGVFRFDWQNDLKLAKNHTVTVGAVFEEENFASDGVARHTADTTSVYVQDALTLWDRLFLTAGLRYEDHSLAGDEITYRLTAAYLFPSKTKLRASYGTGFLAPTLYNLFNPTGSNPNLQPERSRGWDVGVEQAFFNDRLTLSATYFDQRFTDLVQVIDFTTFTPVNVGSAKSQGVELGLSARPTDRLTVGVNYTYTDAEDQSIDKALLRRAPHKIGAGVSYRYADRGDVTLSVAYVGNRPDFDPVTFNRSHVGAYTLVDLATSYRVTEHTTLYGRVENLLDQRYEDVAGFGTAGFALYGGMKVSF